MSRCIPASTGFSGKRSAKATSRSGNVVTLQFNAVVGRAYQVQYLDALDDSVWQTLVDVPASAGDIPVTVTDPAPGAAARFYRGVIPTPPGGAGR